MHVDKYFLVSLSFCSVSAALASRTRRNCLQPGHVQVQDVSRAAAKPDPGAGARVPPLRVGGSDTERMGSNAIEVLVQSLPRRIGAEEIVNVRGIGYRLKAIGQPR